MNKIPQTEGLQFFGKVSASISHELKNILSIISETAGFLNDLTELAKQGKELKLSLIENCSQSIVEEIQRGFATIKQMNRFAHSVDSPMKDVDLVEILELMIGLTGFLSYASRVRIEIQSKDIKPVFTSPFLFGHLIYQILCFFYESAGHDGNVSVVLSTPDDTSVRLTFKSSAPLPRDKFPNEKMERLAQVLGLEFEQSPSDTGISLGIPYISDTTRKLLQGF